MKKILVTGSAGFIGFHLVKKLINSGLHVVGIDNLNNYYDPSLKELRLKKIEELCKELDSSDKYKFKEIDISSIEMIEESLNEDDFSCVIHLAAQAGVRNSLENPRTYIDSNIMGFLNILEYCRGIKPKHLIFASSSSVYGLNSKQPFKADDNTDHPISLYAASKKSNEVMAHSYSHLFNIPITGLRFFTVYGPYGRPDMAYFKFTKSIIDGDEIEVFNKGKMKRDFTYVDDVVDGIFRIIDIYPNPLNSIHTQSKAPFRIMNIGNNNPVSLARFIRSIEEATGKKSQKKMLPMQSGDVPITYADVDDLEKLIGYKPETSIEEGIKEFVSWYEEHGNKFSLSV